MISIVNLSGVRVNIQQSNLCHCTELLEKSLGICYG